MPKKKSKALDSGCKGFEIDSAKLSGDIIWQSSDGFAFTNSPQTLMINCWSIDVLAFKAESIRTETLVILIGPLESVHVYKHLVAAVNSTSNIVFVSLPGFGQNMDVNLDAQDIELKSFGPFVVKLIEESDLAGHKIHLMGSSAAASIALETALLIPEKVSSLITNGLVHRPSKIWQLLLKEVMHRLHGDEFFDCADAALLYLVSDEILARGRTWGVFRRHFRKKLSLLTQTQKNCLSNIIKIILKGDGLNEVHLKNTPLCRVLAYTGEYDHLSAPYDHAHFIDTCVNGIFATLDEADHLIHVERPRVVAQLVQGFIEGVNLDTIEGLRTYPPQTYVTLDRRRDPRYVTSRPRVKLETSQVIAPEDWEEEVPTTLFAKLRNINFSGCLLELHDERFQIENHANDLCLYLPRVKVRLRILAFEQVNKTLRCLFIHENYEAAMAFKDMLEFGEHFVDADLELDDYDIDSKSADRPWLGAKRQGGEVY